MSAFLIHQSVTAIVVSMREGGKKVHKQGGCNGAAQPQRRVMMVVRTCEVGEMVQTQKC